MSELLPEWDDVADDAEWSGILVGNGASIGIWPDFRYESLYDIARSDQVSSP